MSASIEPFLRGWRSLPVELQLYILTLVVTLQPQDQGALSYYYLDEVRYWRSHFDFQRWVLPLLSCPEIKELVVEAFYTQNRFMLEYGASRAVHLHIHLPPESAQKFIRKLRISLGAMTSHELELLAEAARSTKKLENLTFLDIAFTSPTSYSIDIDQTSVFQFESKCLRITSQDYPSRDSDTDKRFGLPDRLVLSAEFLNPETTWTYWVWSFDKSTGDGVRQVESWTSANALGHHVRWTVKEIVTCGLRFAPPRMYMGEQTPCRDDVKSLRRPIPRRLM